MPGPGETGSPRTTPTHEDREPALKQLAAPVDAHADRDLPRLVAEMRKLMREAPGIGLAAPQLGVMKRVIVWEIDDGPAALCNPRLVEASEETETDEEGCLSVPGISVPIVRPARIVCEGELVGGETVRIEADDLLARVLQHETDHCDGIIILDRAAPGERLAAIRRYMTGEQD